MRIKEENQTLATVTLQNYFRLYEKLAGMTGTANTEAGEFAHTYGLEVVSIPTNRAMVRDDEPDLIYKTEEAKFDAVADDIQERHDAGQPVLVGTISVEKSELLSRLLEQARHPARGAQRQAARAGGARRHPGRPLVRRDRRHQHGRARRRHPARRQPRGPGPRRDARRGHRRPTRTRRSYEELLAAVRRPVRRGGRPRCASSAASTCSAPSATRAAGSTTSSGAGPAARATPARAASTSRSRTSSCGCSRPAR